MVGAIGYVNLGRAATLLGLSRYELDAPRRIGPETEDAHAEADAAHASRSR